MAQTEKAAETVPCFKVSIVGTWHGQDEWGRLQAAYGQVPATYTETVPHKDHTKVTTHLFFRDTPDYWVGEWDARISPNVSVKDSEEAPAGVELAELPAWIIERFKNDTKTLQFETFLVSLNAGKPNMVIAKKIAQWCHTNKFGLPASSFIPEECTLWDVAEHTKVNNNGYKSKVAATHPDNWPDTFTSQINSAYMVIVDETAKERAARILPFIGQRPDATPIKPQAYYDADQLIIRRPGKVSLVYGRYSHHKTNFAIKKCLDATLDHGARVVFVAGEDADGVKNRLAVNCAARGLTVGDIADKWLIVGQAPQFRAAHETDSFVFAVEHFKPDLI
jgi:hypothetical protein